MNIYFTFEFLDLFSVPIGFSTCSSYIFNAYVQLQEPRKMRSFRARSFPDAIQRPHNDCKKTNMPLIERSFDLLNTRTICVILLRN